MNRLLKLSKVCVAIIEMSLLPEPDALRPPPPLDSPHIGVGLKGFEAPSSEGMDAVPVLFDPASRVFRQERCATYERMRKADPVHWCESINAWVLFGHRTIADFLRSSNTHVQAPDPLQELMDSLTPEPLRVFQHHMLLFLDAPDHPRMRGLVQKAFSPKAVEVIRDAFNRKVVGTMERWRPGQVVDVIDEVALPLPMATICELLGVPFVDHHLFRTWGFDVNRVIDIPLPIETVAIAAEGAGNMIAYLAKVVDGRARSDPGDDLLGALISAEVEGDRLSRDELIATAALLLIAGHDTTVSLLGNMVHSLLTHADQLQLVRADRTLIPGTVEEVLRFESPLQMATGGGRYVRASVLLEGKQIDAGARVYVMLGSANRDPAAFENAERFDISRTGNRHMAFGKGMHFCLGAGLARMEAHVALGELLDRTESIELVDEAPQWRDFVPLRQLEHLHVRVT